ncbi:UBA and UBX domain-containing protein At4g15410-like protein [Mycena albidolilacea]|uniref:UBA and UBX domain-containing protein At4g15410-like protein n=1 Tax=Mycena albidolilacea TaxID=1033008 RepID=A0AAD6ZLN5_9AGAR|nr:UBA and UBX domain-containing protein At4g15410-like protein [Mycena albidolilacea]
MSGNHGDDGNDEEIYFAGGERSGGGHPLGGEGSASAYVPGAREEVEDELAIRRLTFWRDGFTVEDGPLMRYPSTQTSSLPSTPGTARRVEEDRGRLRAPTRDAVLGYGEYVGGAGECAQSQCSESRASACVAEQRKYNPRFEVDTTQPTSIRVCLADGMRLIARMNLTHTVGDLRGFIDVACPAGRPYTYHRYHLPHAQGALRAGEALGYSKRRYGRAPGASHL